MQKFIRRTWTDINMDAVRHNLELIRSRVSGADIMCIVKADAYGHGVAQLAPEYQSMGIRWFGVSNISEAIELRHSGITEDILILGYTPPEAVSLLSEQRITQAVFSEQYAAELSDMATSGGYSVRCHLKIDSGMGRIGFNCRSEDTVAQQIEAGARVCRLPGLVFDGIFTHFAVADDGEDGEAFTRRQFSCFMQCIDGLRERGIVFRWRHCCNSAATLEYPEMHLDMVRPGVILYGLSPSAHLRGKYDLRPVMQMRTAVSQVKPLEKGATVSYGRTFTAERDMMLATVPIGYADGYPRLLSGRQEVLIHGKRAPIVGRVCMDQMMIDVSAVPDVREGDIVTVFGTDGDASLPIEELGDKLGTINYELVCSVSRRVPRIYYRSGEPVSAIDYLG